MDAIFGLPRKKSAGSSYRDPLYKDLFFSNQLIVDEFVASYENPKSSSAVRKSINVFYFFFHRTAIILWLEMNSEVLLGIKL